jgi:hypothetical protein
MLTGYNTDFKFQGKTYHCQTEDGGVNSPNIISLLYLQGAILASRKTSYADILKADCLDEVVRDLMMEQHKQMIRDLMHGKLDLNNAPHESTYTSSSPAVPTPAPAEEKPSAPSSTPAAAEEKPAAPPTPPSSAEVKDKNLDDVILDFLAQEKQDRDQKKSP